MTKTSLDRERPGRQHHFKIGKEDCVLTINTMGKKEKIVEVFMEAGRKGSTLQGSLEALSIAINVGLRYGVDIDEYLEKFEDKRFTPYGKTSNKEIQKAYSICDYLVKYIRTCRANGGFTNGVHKQEYKSCQIDGGCG